MMRKFMSLGWLFSCLCLLWSSLGLIIRATKWLLSSSIFTNLTFFLCSAFIACMLTLLVVDDILQD